jgi:hypothetical protein
MSAAALLYFADRAANTHRPPLEELAPTPAVLDALRQQHLQQLWPRAAFAAVWNWITSMGGRPEYVLERVRVAGVDPDPHILTFGPALDHRFLSCFARAHAIVPYRVEEGRLYVYDPDHPGDRERYVELRRGSAVRGVEFAYGRFRSQEGWGLSLVPASVLRGESQLLYQVTRRPVMAR